MTFEWHSLRRDLLRRGWLILLAGCIACMGVYIMQRSTPVYLSSATLAVSVKSAASTFDNLSASADTAGIYAAVFQGDSVKALAAANLGMDEFPGEVKAFIVSGINLLMLSVTADDPELAYRLLNSILEIYPRLSNAIFSNAVIDVLEAPQIPTAPAASLSTRYHMLLILLAMVAMTGLIILLSLFKETVKHQRAFEQMINSPLLGTVSHQRPHALRKKHFSRKKEAILIDSAYTGLRFSEDFQKLATRLEHLKRNKEASVFAITSAAEQEGRSTITVNLALALSQRGYRIVVMDLDTRKPSLCRIMGYQGTLTQEFCDVLCGRIAAPEYRFWQYRAGILAALSKRCPGDVADQIGTERTQKLMSDIRSKADFILIDTPPICASADAVALSRCADRTILAVRTDHATAGAINNALATLENVGGKLAGCILNDVYRPFTFWGLMGADDDWKTDGHAL